MSFDHRKYLLPREQYMETIWFIRRYPKLVAEYNAIFGRSKEHGEGSTNSVGDPTGEDALRAAAISKHLDAITKALDLVPEEYRAGLMSNIIERKPYPIYAGTATWRRWRQRFVYYVARNRRYL